MIFVSKKMTESLQLCSHEDSERIKSISSLMKRSPIFRLYFLALPFIAILIFGIAGYMILEDYNFIESLYMTVITLGSVGYTEVRPLSDIGRIFTVILIVLNLGLIIFVIGSISNFFLEGQFQKYYKLYKMNKAISRLSNHAVICGLGRNGRSAAITLQRSNIPFVVIEKDEQKIQESGLELAYYLLADSTHDEALIAAGISRASALITTLPEDADNVFIVLTAREMNPQLRIISRASNDSSVKKLKSAGATNVIMPDKVGGTHMATLLTSPDINEFIDIMTTQGTENFQIIEISVTGGFQLSDLNSWVSTGATILGLKKANQQYHLNPAPNTQIQSGDRLIAMGSKEQLKKLSEMIGQKL